MWGEIDPPVKTQPSLCESEDESELPEEPVTQSQRCDFHQPADTQQPRRDAPVRDNQLPLFCITLMQIYAHCIISLFY